MAASNSVLASDMSTALEIRSITDADWPAMQLLGATSFGHFGDDDSSAAWRTLMKPEASVVACDGDNLVGMAHYLDLQLTVPGGAVLPTAGITWVGVAPTHRRRGVLRAIYIELHRRIAARYPIAALTASEGGIYGRFGYGPATIYQEFTIDRRFAHFHAAAPDPGGVRLVTPAEHQDEFEDIYDRWRRRTPGGLVRPRALWDSVMADREFTRDGGSEWFGLLHPDAYALYRVHRGESKVVRVDEITAATTDAHIALWRVLLGLDLMPTVVYGTHPADPLPYALTDPRLPRTTGYEDGLWLRIMDVPTALEARSYSADVSTVLDVSDGFRDDGGRFALQVHNGKARCTRTDAAAEVQIDLDVLGSIYLGVHRASAYAAANRLRSKDSDVVGRLDAAFVSDVPAELGFGF